VLERGAGWEQRQRRGAGLEFWRRWVRSTTRWLRLSFEAQLKHGIGTTPALMLRKWCFGGGVLLLGFMAKL
jgi:hypothetical protein